MATIKVRDGLEIGDGQPKFVIAEVGSNWKTLEHCLTSINMAKACGADAVKFQLYTGEALYGQPKPVEGSLPEAWIPKLAEHAKAMGIEFMCSAFSPDLYDVVNPYVNIHKVASAECCHLRILDKLVGYGKPVILSTGAKSRADIRNAMCALGYGDWLGLTDGCDAPEAPEPGVPLVLMFCVGEYPAKIIHMGNIPVMQAQFKVPVGYSDHSTDVICVPRDAIGHGACVLEKHVNFIEGLQSPDSPHSLTTDEFKIYVKASKGTAPLNEHARHERPFQLRHNRRLIATKDIMEGDSFDEAVNFGIYRSLKDEAHAYHPFMIDQVHGKIARKNIRAGDGIGPGDVGGI